MNPVSMVRHILGDNEGEGGLREESTTSPTASTRPGEKVQGALGADGKPVYYYFRPVPADIEARIAALPSGSFQKKAREALAEGWDATAALTAVFEKLKEEAKEEGFKQGAREGRAQVAKEYAAVEDEATDAEAAALVGMDLATFRQYKPQAKARTPEEEDEEAARLVGMTVEEYQEIMRELEEEGVDADSEE